MHRIAAVCLEGVVAFDLAVPAQVFTLPHRRGDAVYSFEACAGEGSRAATTSGFSLTGLAGPEAIERADTVIVPGYWAVHEPLPDQLAAALRRAVERGGRVASICTGAFALAHAGLLDGRRATTHWAAAPELARLFPSVEVDPAALYVDEGQVLTSAGLSAGIDLCLHLVRRDHGEAMGAAVARAMVAAPHREGGQAQYIDRPLPARDGSLAATRRWALDRLDQPLDAAALARHAGVSTRTFARRFRAETGATPLQWLLSQRVLEARRLLERTDLPVEEVAAAAGFGTAASLREHFRRSTATTPTAYRRSFRQPLAA
jgi:transcriptional regulator GlxA family with amidase domain